jgi:outer membrane protein assembly factor BamB
MQGEQLWQTNVGSGEGMMGWGTASSPILYKNLVIVTAAAESKSLIALDQTTGKEVWRQEADGLAGTWSTPILVEADGRTDLVLAVPYEIWGINPDTGKLRWFCDSVDSNSACASTIVMDGVVYFVGGRDGGSIAVRAGGKGDVGETHVVWRGRHRARIGTPLADGDNLYWVSRNIANCIRLSDGEEVYEERLNVSTAGASGGGGRGRGQDYSSPVAADGKLYFVTRNGTTFVLQLGDFKQLATNRFASDDSDYSATPAIVDGQIFLRSNDKLYCVEAE